MTPRAADASWQHDDFERQMIPGYSHGEKSPRGLLAVELPTLPYLR